MAHRVTVLGIGNEAMGDDAIGVLVARGLPTRAPSLTAKVIDGGMAGMGNLRHFLECDAMIVVDAIDTGAEPGSVFRFDPDEACVTQLRSDNIHGMGLPYLLTNARMLGASPRVVVYAVQVGDVRPLGAVLSPPVREAFADVMRMVEEEVLALADAEAPESAAG